MPVEILGRYPTITRTRTGLFSLDVAIANKGELGLPTRTVLELYGYSNAGKSTLAYYLASKVSGTGVVAVCDLEMLDRDYLKKVFENSGFSGAVQIMDVTDEKGKPVSDEEQLQHLRNRLYDEDCGSAIIDSVGAIQSLSEAEGDFGEAFMGKRAKLVAQVSRSIGKVLKIKERPSNAFVINHVHGIMGGKGHTTAGGETLKYISATRLMIWTDKVWKSTDDDDAEIIGFQVGGQVEKLRYGGRGLGFNFYIVPGYGVHPGASAMFDCINLGLVEAKTTLKLGGKSLGYIRKDFLIYAAEGKSRKFTPFFEELDKHEKKMMKEMKDNDKED